MEQNQSLSLEDWHQRYKQQAGWSQDVRKYLFGKADITSGDKILEVGSGTSAVLSLLVNEIDGCYFGIDIDFRSLHFSSKLYPHIPLAQGDGFHLPFPDKCFKVTYCHYLLLWVMDPSRILSEMIRVTEPGGSVIALAEPDYQARIDYPDKLIKLGQLQTKSLEEQGIDSAMGRKLAGLFQNPNLKEITSGILGAQWDPNQAFDEKEWMMFESDLGLTLPPGDLETYRKAEARARKRGERVLFIPTFYAAGIVT